MKERLTLAINVCLLLFTALLLATIQTSLWFQVFGYFPAPALWVPCLVYVALFRSTLETIIYSYFLALLLGTMTAMPEGTLMVACLALALSTQLLKGRIYWSSASYIMMVSGGGALLFNIYHWLATFVIGDTPMTSPQVIDWAIQALLTPLVAPLLFPILRWFDRMTGREGSTEASAQVS